METLTLQDVVMAVAANVRDLTTGTTTSISANAYQLVDASKAGGLDRRLVGGQVVFSQAEAVAAGMTGTQPYEITFFTAANGTLTLATQFRTSPNTIPSGLPYFIVRNLGGGNTLDQYKRAIRYALDKLDVYSRVNNVTLVTTSGTYDYTIPAGLDTLYDVLLVKNGARLAVPPSWWEVGPGRKLYLLNRRLDVAGAYTLELRGRTRASVSTATALTASLTLDLDETIDLATEYLTRNSARPQDNAKGQQLMQERTRFNNSYRYPNEVEIL